MAVLIFILLVLYLGTGLNAELILLENQTSHRNAESLCSREYRGVLASQKKSRELVSIPKSFTAWVEGKYYDFGFQCPEGIHEALIVEPLYSEDKESIQSLCGGPSGVVVVNGSTCTGAGKLVTISTLTDLFAVRNVTTLNITYVIEAITLGNLRVSCKSLRKSETGEVAVSYNPCNMAMEVLCDSELPLQDNALLTITAVKMKHECGEGSTTEIYIPVPNHVAEVMFERSFWHIVMPVFAVLIVVVAVIFLLRFKRLRRDNLSHLNA